MPRLISQPKWFKIEKDLKEKDLVYFKKQDSPLSSTWTIGQVDQVIASKDGYIRRAVIKYFNAGEDHPHLTDRAVRKMVKLWSLDEVCLFDDLSELQHRLDGNDDNLQVAGDDNAAEPVHRAGVEGFHCHDGASVNLARDVVVETSCYPPLTSVVGLYCGSDKVGSIAGPVFLTLDGAEQDFAARTTSCDLTPLVVQQPGHDECCAGQSDDDEQEPVGNLDTLHGVLVTTGFALD